MTSPVPNGENTGKVTEMETSSISDLLSFPSRNAENTSSTSNPTVHITGTSSRQLLKDRLFVGNLHPGVDEYTLLQVFSKYGKVTKLDFLFHKAGALKGKPRGYAFIEYGSNDEAQRALTSAHDKLLHGRKLIVTYAHQAPPDLDGGASRQRKTMMETGRPTTLSMLKTGTGGKHKDGTSNKIALMEAKLRQMEATKPKTQTRSGSDVPTSASTLPIHPSLPMKPPPSTMPGLQPYRSSPSSNSQPIYQKSAFQKSGPPSSRSSVPYVSSTSSSSTRPAPLSNAEPAPKKLRLTPSSGACVSSSVPLDAGTKRKTKGKELLGVKIVKKKDTPSGSTPAKSPETLEEEQEGKKT